MPKTKPTASKKRATASAAGGGKRAKTAPHQPKDDPEAALVADQVFANIDIVAILFSYLGVRELYNLVQCSTKYRQRLRHEEVVRSAALDGGHAHISMEYLVHLIRYRQIWIPSPLRLLRLVNGKRCERCFANRANTVSKAFGVFYCSTDCLHVGHYRKRVDSEYILTANKNKQWEPLLMQRRLASIDHPRTAVIWRAPTHDLATKEKCGPLACHEQLQCLFEEYPKADGKERVAHMVQLLEGLDKEDPYASHASTIVETFEACQKDVAQRQREKEDKKQDATDKANEARQAKTRAMMEKLNALVGDVPWKQALTQWKFESITKDSPKKVAKFQSPLVQEQLQGLAAAPSKATKKKLEQAAAALKESFGIVWAKGFNDLSSLAESKDELEQRLREQFRGMNVLFMACSAGTLEQLQEGKVVLALTSVCPRGVETAAATGLAETVARETENIALAQRNALVLARVLLRHQFALASPSSRVYDACKAAFPRVHQKANKLELLNEPTLHPDSLRLKKFVEMEGI